MNSLSTWDGESGSQGMRSTLENLGEGEEGIMGGMAMVHYGWVCGKKEENKASKAIEEESET